MLIKDFSEVVKMKRMIDLSDLSEIQILQFKLYFLTSQVNTRVV